MTRNALLLVSLLLSSPNFATADSPLLQGLGGSGRAGIAKESLFSNPAGAAFITDSSGFVHYTKPKIPELNAGGRGYAVGAYDGAQGDWKGAFAYVRSSRALMVNGVQGYEDKSDFRFTMARPIGGSILAGAQVRYVKLIAPAGRSETKYFEGDVGVILPLFNDIRLGVTYENIGPLKTGQRPGTVGGGVQYLVGGGLEAFADGTRQMSGPRKGDRGWSAGLQLPLVAGFVGRGGKFQDGFRRLRGWSMGLGWNGPRTSFDYALRTTGTKKREKDQVFGMNVVF